jgi:hypothetical protein
MQPSPAPQGQPTQPTEPLCVCLTYIGDNGECAVHGPAPTHRTYKLVRGGKAAYSDTKPYVFGALDFRLYEWTHGEYVQIDGAQ